MRRPLGETERAVWLLDRAGTLNGAFWARVSGPLDPDLLRSALDRVQAAHPLLGVRVEPGEPPRMTSDGVPPIPLRVVEDRGGDGHLAALEAEINEPIPWRAGPLARVTLLREERGASPITMGAAPPCPRSALLITFHHLMGDGASGLVLLREILQTAADLREGKPSPGPPRRPERPPLEALLPPEGRGVSGLRDAAWCAARQLVGAVQRPAKLPPDRGAPPGRRRTCLVEHHLDPAESAALALRCRERGVTIHGALAAALLLEAVAALHPGAGAPRPVVCASPINLRASLVPPIGDEVGMYVSALLVTLPVHGADDPWALARRANAALRTAVERGEHLAAVRLQGLLRAATASPARFSWAAEQLFPAAVELTNLGRVEIPVTYGPFTIEALSVAVGLNVVSGTSLCLAAHSFAGALSLAFHGAEPLLTRGRVEDLSAGVVRRLRAMSEP